MRTSNCASPLLAGAHGSSARLAGPHTELNTSTVTTFVQSGSMLPVSNSLLTATPNVIVRISPGAIHGACGRQAANV